MVSMWNRKRAITNKNLLLGERQKTLKLISHTLVVFQEVFRFLIVQSRYRLTVS